MNKLLLHLPKFPRSRMFMEPSLVDMPIDLPSSIVIDIDKNIDIDNMPIVI